MKRKGTLHAVHVSHGLAKNYADAQRIAKRYLGRRDYRGASTGSDYRFFVGPSAPGATFRSFSPTPGVTLLFERAPATSTRSSKKRSKRVRQVADALEGVVIETIDLRTGRSRKPRGAGAGDEFEGLL